MNRIPAALLAAAALFLPAASRADRRYYGETYNAVTAAPGGLDIEGWTTLYQAPREGGTSFWRHQLEVETGLTDRWDLALYNDFRRDLGGTTRYEALRLESRYRLSQPGEWFVDPVLYLELRKELIEDKPLAVEEKLILGKDLRAWNVSLNLSAEQEFPQGGGTGTEWAWALGSSCELAPALRLGGEAFGDWTKERGASSYARHAWAGPALSLAWSRFWVVVAAGFGLTDASDRTRLRAVAAIQL
jgi:hypothetical protein